MNSDCTYFANECIYMTTLHLPLQLLNLFMSTWCLKKLKIQPDILSHSLFLPQVFDTTSCHFTFFSLQVEKAPIILCQPTDHCRSLLRMG